MPLDGSARSASILHQAKDLAKVTSTVMVLAMIVTPARSGMQELRGRRYLEQAQRQLEAKGFRTESRLVAGRHVSRSILTLAADEHCDMIMLTTHGPSALRRAIRGSVVDAVIRGTTVPVLIQRPTKSADLKARTAAAAESMIAASSGSI